VRDDPSLQFIDWPRLQVDDIIHMIDEDGDGDISFAEFEKWCAQPEPVCIDSTFADGWIPRWTSDHAVELRAQHDEQAGIEEIDEARPHSHRTVRSRSETMPPRQYSVA
jgi:hypothetical protein